MDMNDLLARQQTELMRAHGATCSPSRISHQKLADGYGREINRQRAESGATAAPTRSDFSAQAAA